MKKIIVTLLSFLVIGITASIAYPRINVDPRVLSAFQKEFSFAKNVQWQADGNLTRAVFLLNDQGVSAWYNSNAELVTIARNVVYNQLPISIMRALDKSYGDAGIFGIMEINRYDETYYQMRAERKGKKYLLRVTPSGSIIVLKRIK